MPRVRHMRPAPAGRVLIVCPGRDDRWPRPHDEQKQVAPRLHVPDVNADVLEFNWRNHQEGGPVTGMTDDDRMQTFDFWCGTCRLGSKPNQRQLSRIVKGIAAVSGGWDKPIEVDIWKLRNLLSSSYDR